MPPAADAEITSAPEADREPGGPEADRSLGQLMASASAHLSTLVHQEIELAKLELKHEVAAVGKGIGGFGAAAFCGVLALLFLSVAGAWGLAEWLSPWAGFLIVGGSYLVLAVFGVLFGKRSLAKLAPPERTIATVKGDLAWVRHPTVAPARRG